MVQQFPSYEVIQLDAVPLQSENQNNSGKHLHVACNCVNSQYIGEMRLFG